MKLCSYEGPLLFEVKSFLLQKAGSVPSAGSILLPLTSLFYCSFSAPFNNNTDWRLKDLIPALHYMWLKTSQRLPVPLPSWVSDTAVRRKGAGKKGMKLRKICFQMLDNLRCKVERTRFFNLLTDFANAHLLATPGSQLALKTEKGYWSFFLVFSLLVLDTSTGESYTYWIPWPHSGHELNWFISVSMHLKLQQN